MPKISVGGTLKPLLFSGIEKVWIREGGISRFSVEIFCLTVPRIFKGTFFCCISFGYRKSLNNGGGIMIFRRSIFCLTVPESFVGEPFCAVFRKISGIEKNGKREVEHRIKTTRRSFFGLSLPKISVGESSTAALI